MEKIMKKIHGSHHEKNPQLCFPWGSPSSRCRFNVSAMMRSDGCWKRRLPVEWAGLKTMAVLKMGGTI